MRKRAERDLVKLTVGPKLLKGLRQYRRIDQFFGPHAPDDEDRQAMNSPAEKSEKTRAQAVTPMQILEDEDGRLLRSQLQDQLGERVEQQGVLIRCGDWLVSGLPQFREDANELGAGRRTEAVPDTRVEHGVIAAERVDPGMERQNLFGFMAASDQDAHPGRDRLPGKFPKQPALADASLAAQQDHAPAGIEHFRQRVVQAAELEIAADHRCFLGPGVYLSTQGCGIRLQTVGSGPALRRISR